MSHDRFEEMLARRSELTPAEEQRLEAHLRDCPQCRATAAAYEQQTRLLRSLPPVEPPAALRAGVLAGIQQVPPRRRWWSPRPVAFLGPATAVLLVVAALAVHNLHPGGGANDSSAPAAQSTPVTYGPASGTAGSSSRGSHRPSSQPEHPSRAHQPARTARGQAPERGTASTAAPVQSLPGAAQEPAPIAPTADSAFGPVMTSVPKARPIRSAAPRAPVKAAASHPVPTSQPAPGPPVVVAPVRPTAPAPTPIPITPAPMTEITSTATEASSPVSPATPTPTPTSTARP